MTKMSTSIWALDILSEGLRLMHPILLVSFDIYTIILIYNCLNRYLCLLNK